MRLKRDMGKLRVLDCKDHVLRFVRAAYGNSERPRIEREGMEPKNGARDDAECAKSACDEFGKVVTGDVFDHLAAAGGERAIRKCNGNPDDEVAERAKAQTKRTAIICRENAADGCSFWPERIESEALAVLGKRFLQSLNHAAGFDGDGEVGPGVFEDVVQARGRNNDIGPRGRITPAEFRSATARDSTESGNVGKAERVSQLVFVGGFEGQLRLNAGDCVGGRRGADVVMAEERDELVMRDSGESGRLRLTGCVHKSVAEYRE